MKLGIKRIEDALVVVIRGDISEHSEPEFAELLGKIEVKKIQFDLEKLELVNSLGTRVWMQFIEKLKHRNIEFSFQKCSVAFVECCNMYPRFANSNSIESFYISMICGSCGNVDLALSTVEAARAGEFQNRPCKDCESPMRTQVDPQEYLQFLNEDL